MYNLDNIVRIYYSAVSVCTILESNLDYGRFPRREFSLIYKAYFAQYSETESTQLYDYAKSSIQEMGHPFARMDNRTALNVFAALEELAEQLLVLEGNEVRCIYDKLLRFREITQYLDEDLLVCAFLVIYYKNYGRRIYPDFRWNTTLDHNNVQLRRIMARGISENHFHLFGSAPHFHLLWIYLMNHVQGSVVMDFAREVNARQRTTREHYSVEYTEECFEVRIVKAALIRVSIIVNLMREEAGYGTDEMEEYAEELLSGELDIMAYCTEIQRWIDDIRSFTYFMSGEDAPDYALYMVDGLNAAMVEQYWFAGERWMMYTMLYRELTDHTGRNAKYYRWFYAYLVLKNHVRNELLQTNDTVGFENFSVYSKRKAIDYEKIIEAAVYGSMESGNIQSLEIRIKPEMDACGNAQSIKTIDTIIAKRDNKIPKSRYYYVFHFSKTKDVKVRELLPDRCRHYRKRQQLREQAKAIADFRDRYRELASEVLGIDACSQEIGCRPEVFARVFRYLSMHVVENVIGLEEVQVRQLKKTFHVGEDFLDVVDGLRAVDEAVHFLNLQHGDRIGHGTVLGIDVREWYSSKQSTVLLPKQDYLDNVVWLYHKLSEYKIVGMDNLRAELLREFELGFAEVYLHAISEDEQKKMQFNIHEYYEAWKLRGDEPELYLGGYFDKSKVLESWWLVNELYPEESRNREHHEIAYLYYLYHYNEKVRRSGERVREIFISPAMVEGICAVQKAMQRDFAGLGIGVETNPSSNVAISTFREYEKHPIVALYNKDLTWDMDQIKACPQIYVSINTDDKGVFHTSLENEYALMACAMEHMKDKDGNPLYNRQMIYQWLDNIREMGNMQSFRERKFDDGERDDTKQGNGGLEDGFSA